MKNTYLHRVYQYNRKVFFFLLFFASATLLCNLTGFEITPFFVWGMYSQPEPPADHYDILVTKTGDTKLIDPSSGYTDDTRFYLNAPIAYYRAIRDNRNIDPTLSFLQAKLNGRYRWLGLPFSTEGAGPASSLAEKLFNGEPQLRAFPHWYRRYLEEVTRHPVEELSISMVRAHYDDDQHIAIDSTFLTDTWRNP